MLLVRDMEVRTRVVMFVLAIVLLDVPRWVVEDRKRGSEVGAEVKDAEVKDAEVEDVEVERVVLL